MERYSSIIGVGLLLMFTIWGCTPPQPTVEEQRLIELLEAFTAVANSPRDGRQFVRQLDSIKQQMTALNQMDATNPCLTAAVGRCHSAYVLAGRAWEKRLAATDANRIADLELTYNFSISFASLSLEQAKECYNSP